MKSKMPCEPGPAPLMKLAQATGLCGGMLVPQRAESARLAQALEIRQQAGLHHAEHSRGSMPSMPTTITRSSPPARMRPGRSPHPATVLSPEAQAAATAAERFSTSRRLTLRTCISFMSPPLKGFDTRIR